MQCFVPQAQPDRPSVSERKIAFATKNSIVFFLFLSGFCLQYDRCKLMHAPKHESNGVIYCPDAIYWTAGTVPIFNAIPNGATQIISTAAFIPELPLKLIEKYQVNILFIATFDLTACLKTNLIQMVNLSSVRKIFIYGSQTPSSLVSQVYRYFPNASLTSWYGASELGVVCNTHFKNGQIESGGELCDDCIAKIIDDDGNRCGPNVCGEVCVRSTPPFLYYIDDPEANATLIDNEGFFRSGDIGYFDDNGRLFIKDRKKNLFTIFYFDGILVPFEIEEYLIHMPGIEEVCVVGVPIADGASLPAAVIEPKSNSNLSKQDVFNTIAGKERSNGTMSIIRRIWSNISLNFPFKYFSDHFPKRLWLRAGIYFVESLPKTGSGKLVRREIAKVAIKMFEEAKESDPNIRSYVSDIPEAFRKLIWI